MAVVVACPKFQCSEVEGMECVQEMEGGWVYHPCPALYQCPVLPFGQVAAASCEPSPPATPESVDPEPVCNVYLEEDSPCKSTNDCKRALYCSPDSQGEKVCTKVKRLGQVCSSPVECREGTVCNKGRCVQMFSLEVADEADTKTACKSARIRDGVCQKESITLGELPKACVADSDCTSSIGIEGECVCAANPEGQAYCALHESDEPVKKYLNAVRNVEREEAAMRAWKMIYYPLIKGTKDCWDHVIQEVVEYESKDEIYEKCFSAFLLLSVLPLLV